MDPTKIIGFLDFPGEWNPTLVFLMGGPLLVTIPALRLILRRQRPVLADEFDLPNNKEVDSRSIECSLIFGVGWGLSGLCPEPAVTALASGVVPVFAFVAAMVAGMAVYKWICDPARC